MSRLTPDKRDELLIRLDERMQDVREQCLPAIEKHLIVLNGTVAKNIAKIAEHEARFAEHEAKFREHDGFFKALPFNKRWFWALVVFLILALAGSNTPELLKLLG